MVFELKGGKIRGRATPDIPRTVNAPFRKPQARGPALQPYFSAVVHDQNFVHKPLFSPALILQYPIINGNEV